MPCASRTMVVEQQFDLVAMSNPSALVSKLWNYCSILSDDGLSYGDYVEQLTFLLFGSLAPARSGVARSLRERRLAATRAARLSKWPRSKACRAAASVEST